MSPAVVVLCAVIGAGIIVVTLADVFLTVLFPASGRGPVRRPLSKLTWRVFRGIAGRVHGRRRRDVLSYSGPVLIATTITSWVVLLTVGWALLYWPLLGSQINAVTGPTDPSFGAALYYSGYALTTLGLGDITPATGLARFLTVFESAIGFGTVSMVITYFLSVYAALTRRRTRAALLHHATGGTGRAADLLAAFSQPSDDPELRGQMRQVGAFVQEVCETHRSYPVLRYFHFRQPEHSLPRVLLIVLDSAALLRATGRGDGWPALRLIDGAAHQLLTELVPHAPRSWTPDVREAAVRAFDEQWTVLADADLVSVGIEEGRRRYLDDRAGWEPKLRALAGVMLYRWDDIEPTTHARGAGQSATAGHAQ